MSNVVRGSARRFLIGAGFILYGLVARNLPDVAMCDDSPEQPVIVRVEEDWVLEIGVPDADNTAPQITCVFAPTADVDFAYGEFAVNHHSLPSFVPGGLQLMVWSGGEPIVVNNDPDGGVLRLPNESITWTQALHLGDDSILTFSVRNGRSQTWNSFGDDGRLSVRTVAPLNDLNQYDTEVSVKNSGIGFASNRVKLLKIVAVRRIADDGRVFIDDAEHIVFEHQ